MAAVLGLVGLALALHLQESPAKSAAAPDAVEAALVAGYERCALRRGVVLGLVTERGQRVVVHGDAGKSAPALDGDTLFEIGSVSKTLTGLLLALLVDEKCVALEDPVASLLPEGTRVPERGGRHITLLDLVTHTSGLPRLPGNLRPQRPLDPYADYGARELYAFLAEHELRRDIGTTYEYSNLGAGLLGHALARAGGQSYEDLVRVRILEPLGMRATRLEPPEAARARLAPPHTVSGVRGVPWRFDVLAPAGGFRSSVHDLLRFAAANLGIGAVEPRLARALAKSHEPQRPANGRTQVAFGWHVEPWQGQPNALVGHDGRTGGYTSSVLLLPGKKVGVVVLCNQSAELGSLALDVLRAAAR